MKSTFTDLWSCLICKPVSLGLSFFLWQFMMISLVAQETSVYSGDIEPNNGINPRVIILTTEGEITVELLVTEAPLSVENFLAYVEAGFYEKTIFHRVIPGFMIQAGGLTREMRPKTTRDPIRNEADNGLKNERGTLAMARTMEVNSATSQFFINLADNLFLDHGQRDFGYAVFARVVDGMEIVDKIAGVQTGNLGIHQNVPLDPVMINQIRLVDSE